MVPAKSTRMLAFCLALGAGVSMPAMQAQAQLASPGTNSASHAGQLDVPSHKSQVLTVDRPYAKALVGDPAIADIQAMNDRQVYVLGKAMGTTSLTLYDSHNKLIAVVDVAVGPDVVTLKRQLAELLPGQPIGARISNDAVVLTGTVSSASAVDRAVQIAKTYAGDKVVNMLSVGATQQVMLEVRFSEMTRNTAKQLGVNTSFLSNSGKVVGSIGNAAQSSTVLTSANGRPIVDLSNVLNTFGIGAAKYSLGPLSLTSALDALETKGVVTTLAEPTLVALSGETASFLAGGEFPIPVSQSSSSGTGNGGNAITIEFKPFGVSLGFTPTVLDDGIINLVVEPEVSSIDPSASVTINGLTIPGLQTRRASTTLELRDGQSFALAGLLRRDFQDTVRQFPILGSLPIIGALFRSSGFQKGENELVIIVTPRLVKPMQAEDVSLPSERVKPPHELDLFLMGRTDKAVGINPLDPNAMPPEAPKAPKAAPAPAKDAPAKGATPSGYEL